MKLLAHSSGYRSLDSMLSIGARYTSRAGKQKELQKHGGNICIRCQLRVFSSRSSRGSNSRPLATKPPTGFSSQPTQTWRAHLPVSALSTSTQRLRPEPSSASGQTTGSTTAGSSEELPSHSESRRHPVSKRITNLLDTMQSNLFVASKRLNDLTGYTPIETLKNAINTQEEDLASTRQRVRTAKASYQDAIAQRSASQREVNSLLQRKHAWSATDLERFTSLYRNDHTNEQAEAAAGEELAKMEQEVERQGEELGRKILRRYHEEQVWSDKIRRMSTWGTWGLMGVNVLLFFVFQVGVEPWRRQRLVNGFEEKVKQAIEQGKSFGASGGGGAPIGASQDSAVLNVESTMTTPSSSPDPTQSLATPPAADQLAPPFIFPAGEPASPGTVSREPASWPAHLQGSLETYRTRMQDLFSDRAIAIRKRDLTTVALEAAATGAAVMGALCLLLVRRG